MSYEQFAAANFIGMGASVFIAIAISGEFWVKGIPGVGKIDRRTNPALFWSVLGVMVALFAFSSWGLYRNHFLR